MRFLILPSISIPLLALAACKPPPTDADLASRDAILTDGPSEPIDSPDTEGAIWADSRVSGRLLYGIPGQPPLLALECIGSVSAPAIRITRFASADKGAGALAAFIGNGHVARIPVDATEVDDESMWQGEVSASDPRLEVLTGRREVALTIPGAGRMVLNASSRPGELIESCRLAAEPPEGINASAEPAL